jgi:hypothetical protein
MYARARLIAFSVVVWLARQPLLSSLLRMCADLKELLFEAYESGRLIACVAFVAKVLEGIPESRIFKPPNPWTMGLLNAMRELYDVAEIKLNLRFEVEVRVLACEHPPPLCL